MDAEQADRFELALDILGGDVAKASRELRDALDDPDSTPEVIEGARKKQHDALQRRHDLHVSGDTAKIAEILGETSTAERPRSGGSVPNYTEEQLDRFEMACAILSGRIDTATMAVFQAKRDGAPAEVIAYLASKARSAVEAKRHLTPGNTDQIAEILRD
jgi:hypothetical protein